MLRNISNNLFENLIFALVFSAIVLKESLKMLAIFFGFVTVSLMNMKDEYLVKQIVSSISDF